MIAFAVIAVVVGVGLLAIAADQFVLGAARLALAFAIRPLVVGVVIVGFGTSAPELLVSAIAAARGDVDIAVGNVVGSNIANLSLLLGVGAMLTPLAVSSRVVRREALLVVAAVSAFALFVQGGGLSTLEGGLLLLGVPIVGVLLLRAGDGDPVETDTADFVSESSAPATEILRTVVGLVGTIGAAQLLLWGALELAAASGLSGGFVGATLVAVGTSLPELVTVVQAARRRETDLIVGNLLGSNLFNALAVGGVIGVLGGQAELPPSLAVLGTSMAVAVAVLAAAVMWTGLVVSRREGIALVVAYAGTVVLLL